MVNIISVDVEEYFHAANLAEVAPRGSWDSLESRVVESTEKTLGIFDRNNTKGTFFILGQVAKKYPQLVNIIKDAGHEIASHGFDHFIAYEQTPDAFFQDVDSSKKLLEDISGEKILGYRAPNFSITSKNQWAYDALIRAGYTYDSSTYPVWHPRYANLGASTEPVFIEREEGKILEFPLVTFKPFSILKALNAPVAGGAYWRLFPLWYSLWGLKKRQNLKNSCNVCYFHPWEIDPDQPFFEKLDRTTQIRHYAGTKKFEKKLDSILSAFKFETFAERSTELYQKSLEQEKC